MTRDDLSRIAEEASAPMRAQGRAWAEEALPATLQLCALVARWGSRSVRIPAVERWTAEALVHLLRDRGLTAQVVGDVLEVAW